MLQRRSWEGTKMGLGRPTMKLEACPNPTQPYLGAEWPEGDAGQLVATLDYKRDF